MGDKRGGDGSGGVLITDVAESRAMNPNKDGPKRNACLRTQRIKSEEGKTVIMRLDN